MQLRLLQISGAPPSWRVRLGLAFKGLAADIRTLSASDRENEADDIRKLNPRGTLPILVADGLSLHGSLAILAWLDRRHPDVPLFGATPDKAAEIWQLVMDCYDDFREANHKLLSVAFASRGELPQAGTADAQMLEAGAALAHAECRALEARLSDGRPYLCGDLPSAADALVYPETRLIERAIETKAALMRSVGFGDMHGLYPLVSAWMARLNAMPEVARTLPEHWTEKSATD
ncbi:glutathione S-transferase family protein [Roseobacter sp.]|uniref:glutathione S-transferase family protein n=1 Tax=Roseobacter sp. TaxID=1907202 RepID=UPI0029669010|nr:glutathione S-transferase family protein [Roseobacter sp.]MDW3181730.1 glutathione S-transferase family protein [Roseobacter sp.]